MSTLKKTVQDAWITKLKNLTGLSTYVPAAQVKVWDDTTTYEAGAMALVHAEDIGEDSGSVYADLIVVLTKVSIWFHKDIAGAAANHEAACALLETYFLTHPTVTISGWNVSYDYPATTDNSDESFFRLDFVISMHLSR